MSLKYTTATWNIIEKFFYDNPQVLVQHHISSYNEFFKTGLQSVFKEKNPFENMAIPNYLGLWEANPVDTLHINMAIS